MNKKAAAVYLMVLLIVVDAELAMTYYSVTAGLLIYALLLFALITLSILPIRRTAISPYLSDRMEDGLKYFLFGGS
jgi:hypothetical protein